MRTTVAFAAFAALIPTFAQMQSGFFPFTTAAISQYAPTSGEATSPASKTAVIQNITGTSTPCSKSASVATGIGEISSASTSADTRHLYGSASSMHGIANVKTLSVTMIPKVMTGYVGANHVATPIKTVWTTSAPTSAPSTAPSQLSPELHSSNSTASMLMSTLASPTNSHGVRPDRPTRSPSKFRTSAWAIRPTSRITFRPKHTTETLNITATVVQTECSKANRWSSSPALVPTISCETFTFPVSSSWVYPIVSSVVSKPTPLTTSTIYATSMVTVTRCPGKAASCKSPATVYRISSSPISTTICPVTTRTATSPPTNVSSPIIPASAPLSRCSSPEHKPSYFTKRAEPPPPAYEDEESEQPLATTYIQHVTTTTTRSIPVTVTMTRPHQQSSHARYRPFPPAHEHTRAPAHEHSSDSADTQPTSRPTSDSILVWLKSSRAKSAAWSFKETLPVASLSLAVVFVAFTLA